MPNRRNRIAFLRSRNLRHRKYGSASPRGKSPWASASGSAPILGSRSDSAVRSDFFPDVRPASGARRAGRSFGFPPR
ncbi:hypothetical protein GCM10022285_64950 [Streptomyces tunisiensis]|uniref:Uncharacterized protein n=1 Tax=Streptomyces tunisiensis TaxID=948699 RepID=A0ABP7ZBF9_9ACTN